MSVTLLGGNVELKWKSSPDPRMLTIQPSGYVLMWGNASGAYNQSTNVGNVTSATIGATFLGSTSYFASVYGVNAAGNGTTKQDTLGYFLCVAPTNVALTVSSLTSWTITWTAPSFATGYSWALSTSATNASGYTVASGSLTGQPPATTVTQNTALSSSTLYYVFVYATRTESKSVYGSGSFTTPAPPTATAAVPTVSGNTITYTWTVSGASSFTVTLYKTTSTAASGGSSVATATTGTSSTFTMTSSGFYYIIITAQNSIGVQSSATSASALSATFTAPPTPTAATPTASVLPYTELATNAAFPTAGTSFSLLNTGTGNYSQWYKLMIRYVIASYPYYFTTPANTGGQDVTVAANDTYNDFIMPAGNITSLIIKAVNVNYHQTEITYTNTSGIITNINSYNSYAGASPTTDTVLSVRTGGPVLTYSWGTSSGTATGYTVNLYAVGNATALVTLTNTTATSATYTPVAGTSYYTTVTATNAGGTSTAAQSANFTYVAPPTATATTPIITSAPYTVLSSGVTYPADGTRIILTNTGSYSWSRITIIINSAYKLMQDGITYDSYAISTAPGSTIVFILPASTTGFEVIVGNTAPLAPQTADKSIINSSGIISAFPSDNFNILSIMTGGPTLTYSWGVSSGSATSYTVKLYSTVAPSTPLVTLTNTTTTTAIYTPIAGTTYNTTVVATNSGGNSTMVTSSTVITPPLGGTVTVSGSQRTHTFTRTIDYDLMSFPTSFTPTSGSIEIFLVGGGGGGGVVSITVGAGGGGGGGNVVLVNSASLSGFYRIMVGSGGGSKTSGNSTYCGYSLIALGGGAGASGDSTTAVPATTGGSGGGGNGYTSTGAAAGTTTTTTFGTVSQNLAKSGGAGYFTSGAKGSANFGGGGGGASTAGGNATSSGAGAGGSGYVYNAITYGSGGGGAATNGASGSAGSGGGSGGGSSGGNGTANTGGGGGGAASIGTGGTGGSGIVIIKYNI